MDTQSIGLYSRFLESKRAMNAARRAHGPHDERVGRVMAGEE